jgi:hypothetical protein
MEKSITMTFTRPPVEDGKTYHDTALLIKRLDPNDPEWIAKAARLIKRYTHHEKYTVYTRIYNYADIVMGSDFPEFLQLKIKTHSQLYGELSEEIKKES